MDTSKSLAQLTGNDWGVAPAHVGTLIRERHEIRRTPIRDSPHAAIVRFLDMGSDADVRVPVALDRLRNDPDAVGLLYAVLRAKHFAWHSHFGMVAVLRDRVYRVTSEIGQITSDIERLQYEAAVWRLYAEFERGLSVV